MIDDAVTPRIRPRSRRPLTEACQRAGLAFPRTINEIGTTYLRLLVEGVDFADVGRKSWTDSILRDAPRDRAPLARRWETDE